MKTAVPINVLRELVQSCVEGEGHRKSDADIITEVSPPQYNEFLLDLLCTHSTFACVHVSSRQRLSYSDGVMSMTLPDGCHVFDTPCAPSA